MNRRLIERFLNYKRYIIKHGEDVDTDYLSGINEVDRACYDEKYWGEDKNTADRYLKNRQSFIFVEDTENRHPEYPERNRIAGYINFFPCEDPLYRDNIGVPGDDGKICDHIRDDDITPGEVALYRPALKPGEEGRDDNHLFIISIAVHPDYQGGEVMKILSDAFISYLAELNRTYPVKDIIGTAVSDDGRKALSRFLFRKLRSLDDGNTVYICDGERLKKLLANDLYIKDYNDDLYLLLPFAEHADNLRVRNFINDRETDPGDDEISEKLIGEVRKYIEYECSNVVARDLRIVKLGTFEFLHTTDDYFFNTFGDSEGMEEGDGRYRWMTDAEVTEDDKLSLLKGTLEEDRVNDEDEGERQEVIFEDVKGYAVLFAHPRTHMFVLTVYFPDYPQSTTQMLDQMSYGYLKIRCPEDHDKYVPLYEYLLKNYGLHACGEQKAMIYIDRLPENEKEFQDMLAAETVNNYEKDYQIRSREIAEEIESDEAQYENYEVYLSSRTIVYRHVDKEGEELTDPVRKIEDVADYLFIVILTLFQNTALAKVNAKVTNLLENDGDVTIQAKLEIDREYGQTIRFWETQNFKYLPAQLEAEHIRKAFKNSELKETYKEHQEYLEHVVEVKNAITDQRNGLIIDVVAVVLALIQIQPFIVDLAKKLYAALGIEVRNAAGTAGGAITDPETTFNFVLVGGVVLFIVILRILRRRNSVTRHRQLR